MRLTRTHAIRWTATLFVLAATSAFAQTSRFNPTETVEFQKQFQHDTAVFFREKATRTHAMRKLDQTLIYAVRLAKGENPWKELPKLQIPKVVQNDGTVVVELRANVTSSLIAQIRMLGGQVRDMLPAYRSLSALLPVRSLEAAAMLPGVSFIKTPSQAAADVGNKQNEGDVSMRTNQLRTVYGLSGAGVKMGLISDSNDFMENSQATGDLPANVEVLSNRSGRNGSGEGTAMMELAYDVAPGANLAFSTAFGDLGQLSFAQNYRDLFAAGCRVIADDIFYYDEPAFQDGPVADAVNDIFAAGGICFSSAGNAGNLRSGTSGVWEGDFADSGLTINYPDASVGKFHKWTASNSDWNNQIPTVGLRALSLQWNDPWGAATSDYDLIIVNSQGQIVSGGATDSIGKDPVEIVSSATANQFAVAIKHIGNDRVLRLNQVRGTLRFANGGQTWGHNSAANGIGVAAINAANPSTRPFNAGDVTTSYSSDGLRRIYYDENGAQISPNLTASGALIRNRPVLAGPDGVSTTVPGFSTFYGTSAASPNVGALAVLLREFAPDATPTDILNALTGGAVDILVQGYDKDSGAGAASGQGSVRVLMEGKTLGVAPGDASVTDTAPTSLTLDIGRNAPPAGLTANVTATGDTGQFSLPTTVSIAAGQRTVSFNVSASGAGTGSAILSLREAYSNALLGTSTVRRDNSGVSVAGVKASKSLLFGGVGFIYITASISGKAPVDYPLEISTDQPSVVNIPSSTTVKKGGTSKRFELTANPVGNDTTVTIRARKQGSTGAWQETTITVKAPTPGVIALGSGTGYAGTKATGYVRLKAPAPAGGYTLDLTTTDATLVPVPATLAFAAGATEATFSVTIGAATAAKTVRIRAFKGEALAQATYSVLVPEVESVTLNPTSLKGGAKSTGTVTLNTPARVGGITIKLKSSDSAVTLPATLTFAEGVKKVSFTVTTTKVTAQKTVTITASNSSTAAKTVTLTVNP